MVSGKVEEWRDVPGYELFYQASSHGRIRSVDRHVKHPAGGFSLRKGKVISPRLCKSTGRLAVSMSMLGITKTMPVHTAVCMSFNGPRPKGLECAHLDGDKINNCSANLKWCTKVENESHKWAHGTMPKGDRNGARARPDRVPRGEVHGMARLSRDQVMEIRRTHHKNGVGCRRLARLVGVTSEQIKNVINERHWK